MKLNDFKSPYEKQEAEVLLDLSPQDCIIITINAYKNRAPLLALLYHLEKGGISREKGGISREKAFQTINTMCNNGTIIKEIDTDRKEYFRNILA